VAEAFITDELAQKRRGKRAEHDLRSSFIAAWADRPIRNVSKLDVLEFINAKSAGYKRLAGGGERQAANDMSAVHPLGPEIMKTMAEAFDSA